MKKEKYLETLFKGTYPDLVPLLEGKLGEFQRSIALLILDAFREGYEACKAEE